MQLTCIHVHMNSLSMTKKSTNIKAEVDICRTQNSLIHKNEWVFSVNLRQSILLP